MTPAGMRPPASPLPPRPADGHKGTFGTVLVIGGCDTKRSCMVGGPAFAAIGALRAGAGRAILAVPRTIVNSCLEVAPSATGLPLSDSVDEAVAHLKDTLNGVQAVVIGPGLGVSDSSVELVARVLQASCDRPVVLDADGLNVVSRELVESLTGSGAMVLTPHPGEYDRLANVLDLPIRPRTEQERQDAASALSRASRSVVVLKGQGTIVSEADRSWTCDRGSVALATGGSGDVLAGIIGGLMAQGRPSSCAEAWDLAVWGTWIHAVAGEEWSTRNGTAGLLAADLAAEVPAVLKQVPRLQA